MQDRQRIHRQLDLSEPSSDELQVEQGKEISIATYQQHLEATEGTTSTLRLCASGATK